MKYGVIITSGHMMVGELVMSNTNAGELFLCDTFEDALIEAKIRAEWHKSYTYEPRKITTKMCRLLQRNKNAKYIEE